VDFLDRLARVLAEVREQLPSPPGSVFLTGGMSRAPYVQALIRAAFPQASMVRGDPSLGVVSGLANHDPSR